MGELIAEATNAVMNGTDSAVAGAHKEVEVMLDVRGGEAAKSIQESQDRPRPMAAVLERIRAREAGQAEETPPAAEEPAGDTPPETAAEEEAPPEEAKPADPPAEEPAGEAPDVASLRAENEAARAELAAMHARMQSQGEPSEDDRAGYIADQLGDISTHIARRLGVKPDHPAVEEELTHLLTELTIRKIGASNLTDDRKSQHAREQSDRRWRLDQQARATSREAAPQRESRQRAVQYVASTYEGLKGEFPALAFVSEFDSRPTAEVVMDVYAGAVARGLIDPNQPDDKLVREALRLTNQIYDNKLSRIRGKPTSTAPATAPAPDKSTGTKPGAPTSASSKPPGKPAAASARTLSARQAAAAPVARTEQPKQKTIVEVDLNDRNRSTNRAREIANKHFGGPK